MKIFVWFLIILVGCFANAQLPTGIVKYGLIISDDADFDNGPAGDFLNIAKESAHFLSYTLQFNEYNSVFTADSMMNMDNNGISTAIMFSGVNGSFYNFYNSNNRLQQIDHEDLGKIIITFKDEKNWELLNETKMIDGLSCLKASRILTIDNGDAGIFKRTIIAWYCPSIPVSFGPAGESGLPGLILELHNRNVIFGVKNINLNPKTPIEITIPKGGVYFTEQQYFNKLKNISDDN